MTNCSKYQNNYWYPKVAEYQHGEYCNGCGIDNDSKGFKIKKDGKIIDRKFTRLVLDKINNDGNHTVKDNKVSDFQLLCIPCNRIKNPSRPPVELVQTQSEQTNRRAEKPLFEWLMGMLRDKEQVKLSYFISEGAYKFDISPETIEKRYYKKYLSDDAVSSPFMIWSNHFDVPYIILKNQVSNLDIEPPTPTPLMQD